LIFCGSYRGLKLKDKITTPHSRQGAAGPLRVRPWQFHLPSRPNNCYKPAIKCRSAFSPRT